MNDLHDLLANATDRMVSPRLEQAAWEIARRRRTRRRGTAAAAVASALVVTIVVALQGGEGPNSLPPSSPSTPLPSHSPTTDPTSTPGDSGEKVWPQWDPRDVDQLPAAPAGIAPALPEVIDSPDSSPQLSDDPVAAAVLAVEHDDVAQVLGTDGGGDRCRSMGGIRRSS